MHHYNEDHNTTSAKEIVPYILEILPTKPYSILDVGCGLAQWLKVFKDYGINDVLGIDGDHVPNERKNVDTEKEYKVFDLQNINHFELSKKFDLTICLEVAEHLSIQHATDFVKFLVKSSDIIIFSAAVVGQTGENHVNEQSPLYWKALFKENGYCMIDAFRKTFWNNNKVNWWYRQNMFLVIKECDKHLYQFEEFENFYIHPELFYYKEKLRQNYSPQKTNQTNIFNKIIRKILK